MASHLEQYAQDHDQHLLLPFHRFMLYQTVLRHRDRNRVLSWFNVITARHVLPIWNTVWPDDTVPANLIDLTVRSLTGEMLRASDQAQLGKADDHLERLGYSAAMAPGRSRAFYAGSATLSTFRIALRGMQFDGVEIRDDFTDDDLDPTCSDPALDAVRAYAGAMWEENNDAVKRLEFWRWWLRDALAEAWQQAYASR